MQSATNLHKQRFHPCLDELACTHLAHMPFMWWIDFELIPLIVQPISRVGNGLLSWLNALRRLLFPFQPILDLLIFMQLCGGRGRLLLAPSCWRRTFWKRGRLSRLSFLQNQFLCSRHKKSLELVRHPQNNSRGFKKKKPLWLDFVPTPLSFLSTANRSGNFVFCPHPPFFSLVFSSSPAVWSLDGACCGVSFHQHYDLQQPLQTHWILCLHLI